MNELMGWSQVFVCLCGGDVSVGQQVHLLRGMLDGGANASRTGCLAPLRRVSSLPPEARLLLVPGVGGLLGDPRLEVRREARKALLSCIDVQLLPGDVSTAMDGLVLRADPASRRALLGKLVRWLGELEPPKELGATPVVARALVGVSLLGPACANADQSELALLPRPHVYQGWLREGHLLLREALVRWLGTDGLDRREARAQLAHSYQWDPDPFVGCRALLTWARLSPPSEREGDLQKLLTERRWLRWWKGPQTPSVELSVRQQLEMVGGSLVQAMASLAMESTKGVDLLLPELEQGLLPGGVHNSPAPQRFDLLGALKTGASRADNARIFALLEAVGPPPFLLGCRVEQTETFDVGLEAPVSLSSARQDLVWCGRANDIWSVKSPFREEDRFARTLADRFVLGAPSAPTGVSDSAVGAYFREDTEDRGWWMYCTIAALSNLLRSVPAPSKQSKRLTVCLMDMGMALQRAIVSKDDKQGNEHPLRQARGHFTGLLLNREHSHPDDFPEGSGDLALVRLCASALRSLPGSAAYRWIEQSTYRLEQIALRGDPKARPLALFVLAMHRRDMALPTGCPEVTEEAVNTTSEAAFFLNEEQLDSVARYGKPSAALHACVEWVARAIEDDSRPIPVQWLTLLYKASQPMVAQDTRDWNHLTAAWTTAFERLSLRLMLAWARAPKPPRPALRELLHQVLRDAPSPAVDVLLGAWDGRKGSWMDDRELVGRLSWRLAGSEEGGLRWTRLDAKAVIDQMDRQEHLLRLLRKQPESGRLVPLWAEARRHGGLTATSTVRSGRIQVEERGEAACVVRVDGPGEPCFVHGAPGAVDLPCLYRVSGDQPPVRPRLGSSDVLVAMLTDVEHPAGYANRLRFLGVEGEAGVFHFEGDTPLVGAEVLLLPGQLLDLRGQAQDLGSLDAGTVLRVVAVDRVETTLLAITELNDELPRLRRLFRKGERLELIRLERGEFRFAIADQFPAFQLPIPHPDDDLQRDLAALEAGMKKSVSLTASWEPEHRGEPTGATPRAEAPRLLGVTRPIGERRVRCLETAQAMERLLALEVGQVLEGDDLQGSRAEGWWLDGLPLTLTEGAESLAPRGAPPLSPPLRIAHLAHRISAGKASSPSPITGIVRSRVAREAVVCSVENGVLRDVRIDTDMDLEPGDLIAVEADGSCQRTRRNIEACPLLELRALDDHGGGRWPRLVRFLHRDPDDASLLCCQDPHTLLQIPVSALREAPAPAVGTDLKLSLDGAELRATPQDTGPERWSVEIMYTGDAPSVLRLRPLQKKAGSAETPAPRVQSLDHLLSDGAGHRIEARLERTHDGWNVRPVGMRGQPIWMDASEFCWDPLRRLERKVWQGPVWVWRENGQNLASVRRIPALTLAQWVQNTGLQYMGSRPLLYAGTVPANVAASWALPEGVHQLLEVLPGTHLAIPHASLLMEGLAPGDRITRYRVRNTTHGLQLEVIAVDVEFANMIEHFDKHGGLLCAQVVDGRACSLTDDEGQEHRECAYDIELQGNIPKRDGDVYLKLVRREPDRLVFRVVPPGELLVKGNLLLVEVCEREGVGHLARLGVRTLGGPSGLIHANEFSEDRFRLGADPPEPGRWMLARVIDDSGPTARLSCTKIPTRRLASLFGSDTDLEVIAKDTSNRGAEVEIEPGWHVLVPWQILPSARFKAPQGFALARGDRLVLQRDPRGFRLNVRNHIAGPWHRLPPGTAILVQPWGTPEGRLRDRREGKAVNGHVVGASATVVFVREVPEDVLRVNTPFPAEIRSRPGDSATEASYRERVGEWDCHWLSLCAEGALYRSSGTERRIRWAELSFREASSRAELRRTTDESRWRTEGGGPEIPALPGRTFLARDRGQHAAPVVAEFDHVLEQFQGPGGVLDTLRHFVVADVDERGLIVELAPRRYAEIPWEKINPPGEGRWAPGLRWDPGVFGRGDLLGMACVGGAGLRLKSHKTSRLRLLRGAVLPLGGRTDGAIGPPGLAVLAELAGEVPQGATTVQLGEDGLSAKAQLAEGDIVFLVPSRKGPVLFGFEHRPWRWFREEGDPLGLWPPSQDLVTALNSLACTVIEVSGAGILLSRRAQLAALAASPEGTVWPGRAVEVLSAQELLVEIGGIPWALDGEAWCEGGVNLLHPKVRALLARGELLEFTRQKGQWSVLATRSPVTGELDVRVLAHVDGLLVSAQGRTVFVPRSRLAWASLQTRHVEALFPLDSTLRLAPDPEGGLSPDGVGAVRQDLQWLKQQGGPVLVHPLALEPGEPGGPPGPRGSRLGRLSSGLVVDLVEALDAPSAGWARSFQQRLRRILISDKPCERVWDLPDIPPEARLAALTHPGVPALLPGLEQAAAAAAEGRVERARDALRRLWEQLRGQATRTLLLPHPRHLAAGQGQDLIRLLAGLARLPEEPKQRIERLRVLCTPEAHSFRADAQAVRCWLAWLTGQPLDLPLDRLRAQLLADSWDRLPVQAGTWVMAAALSFARGEMDEGLRALTSWNGVVLTRDPWTEAASFWRAWLLGSATTPVTPVQHQTPSAAAFLAHIERLAIEGPSDLAEVQALQEAWLQLRIPWVLEPVVYEISSGGR